MFARLFHLSAALLLFNATVQAQPSNLVFESAARQTALLELYTSEGCSSCPPAETWLSRLKDSPGLWKDFVPAAFHVDYWDNLGWRDGWGSKEFSDRQRAYAEQWRAETIYTPGFVLNGAEWRDWSLHGAPTPTSGAKPGVLIATAAATNQWRINFTPSDYAKTGYEVHAALLGGEVVSEVKAGENAGHRLRHDFIVLSLAKGSLVRHGEKAEGEILLHPGQKRSTGSLALAVWVTQSGKLEPLQATGGWLVRPH